MVPLAACGGIFNDTTGAKVLLCVLVTVARKFVRVLEKYVQNITKWRSKPTAS